MLLLDTQVWLWMHFSRTEIRTEALDAIQRPDNDRLVSLASYWEISIKHGLDKLPLPEPLEVFLPTRLIASAASRLDITPKHVIAAGGLPHIHRDPFDRLLIAQAQVEGITLVTADQDIARYDVDILWANRRARSFRGETSP